MRLIGVIAQLVERCNGIAEVSGSNPLSSIHISRYAEASHHEVKELNRINPKVKRV
jgi:hypothetical protein